jgi:GNAT superfamily N-acetyltransferase
MEIAAPVINLRLPAEHARSAEMTRCCDLVMNNWGEEAAARCYEQFVEYWKGGPYAPVFVVATDDRDQVIGFAAYHRSMLMKGTFDLIWIAVDEHWQGCDVGRALTDWRINEITAQDGQMILLTTQKPAFFSKFGFFKLHHVGNEWYLMLKLLTTDVDI